MLVVEKNNYVTKILNVYIIYDLDNWLIISLDNFILKNFLFGLINIVKNSDKSKNMYRGYGAVFHVAGLRSFGSGIETYIF